MTEEELDAAQLAIARAAVTQFKLSANVLAFDTTNFDTHIATTTASALARRGHAKSKRSDLRVVGLGILASETGHVPLLHRTYPGNSSDQAVLSSCLKTLGKLHDALDEAQGRRKAERTVVRDGGFWSEQLELDLAAVGYFSVISLPLGHGASERALKYAAKRGAMKPLGGALRGVRAARLVEQVGELNRTLVVVESEELLRGQKRGIAVALRKALKHPRVGALAFLQRFGSALQLTPHFHVLLPEAVFEELSQTEVRACALPPPDDEEVETLLRTVALRVVKLLRARGKLAEAAPCEDALDFLRARAVRQQRLPLGEEPPPGHKRRRCAFLEGFSLHADTWVHENDRQGLERLANYGARGPLSLERLSQLPDGRLSYRMKRPSSAGATTLEFTPVDFLRRVAALIPPPRVNLVRFFGVLAPNANLRSLVVPAPPPPTPPPPEPPPSTVTVTVTGDKPPLVRPPSRIPWADLLKRTWSVDLLTCTRCGGKRRVVACVFSSTVTAEILTHLGLPAHPLPLAPATDPPQRELLPSSSVSRSWAAS